jgi:AraC-like DNA-binding protein
MSNRDGGTGEAPRFELQSGMAGGRTFAAEPCEEGAREIVARVASRTFTSLDPAAKGQPPGGVAAWTVKHISIHFAEEITLDDLARGVRLSKFHFLRKFHKEVGLTPGAFLKRYRIVQAMERLTATRRPIREVAQMVGYKDATAFSRAFMRVTGTQPYLFRETRRLRAPERPERSRTHSTVPCHDFAEAPPRPCAAGLRMP